MVDDDFSALVELMAKLRSPDGCPWDIEQTPHTIKQNILEEACEVIDAIESGDQDHIKEELGDLLLQVVFQAQMATEEENFGISDVINGITEKLVRRHPHIFGEETLTTSGEVLRNWERIKATEKEDFSHLGSVPMSLPALALSQKLQKKAAKAGFDWPTDEGAMEKLVEEIEELREARTMGQDEAEEEFGDILFTLVNLGNRWGIDSEIALRRVSIKFKERFDQMEKMAKSEELDFKGLTLEEKEVLWVRAKDREQRAESRGQGKE